MEHVQMHACQGAQILAPLAAARRAHAEVRRSRVRGKGMSSCSQPARRRACSARRGVGVRREVGPVALHLPENWSSAARWCPLPASTSTTVFHDTSDRSGTRRQIESDRGAGPRWPSRPHLHGAQLLERLGGKTYMALRMEFYGGRTAPTYWQHTALMAQPENAKEPPVYGCLDPRCPRVLRVPDSGLGRGGSGDEQPMIEWPEAAKNGCCRRRVAKVVYAE